MIKFPKDIPKRKAIKILEYLGFKIVREENHIAMIKENPDGTKIPLTLPNHKYIKGSTLRHVCTQAGISRKEFLRIYEEL